MKRIIGLLLLAVMLVSFIPAGAKVEQSALLDAAFSMIEDGNIFLRRYNEITGAEVEPLFELGLPYFFGGTANDLLMSRYPGYGKRKIYERTKFYQKDKVYIYGLDCSGYTQYVYAQAGMPPHDKLDQMILKYDYERKGNHIYNHRAGHEMPPFNELKDHLIVGDLLVAKLSARHIMMYIGTLADFGFTAEEVPELADYLDYPLVIHCGPSPVAGERFQQLIDSDEYYKNCLTTNGCVEVSIIGIPMKDAPHQEHVQITDYSYFLIEEEDGYSYKLTIWDLLSATSFCWFRMNP